MNNLLKGQERPISLYEYLKRHFISHKLPRETMKSTKLEFRNGISVIRCSHCRVEHRYGERFFILEIFFQGIESWRNVEEYSVDEHGIAGMHKIENKRIVPLPGANQFDWYELISTRPKEVLAEALLSFVQGVIDHPQVKCRNIGRAGLSG